MSRRARSLVWHEAAHVRHSLRYDGYIITRDEWAGSFYVFEAEAEDGTRHRWVLAAVVW